MDLHLIIYDNKDVTYNRQSAIFCLHKGDGHMANQNIEQLFHQMDEATKIVEQDLSEPYLDSLAVVFEYLLFEELPSNAHDMFSHKFKEALNGIDIDELTVEQKKKLIELLILKGMKDSTQPQHLLTPETIGLFISYLVNKLLEGKKHIRIFDPACGTAHLLTTVLGQWEHEYAAYGSEVDPTLIRLAVNSANLQKMEIEFFHQDSLRPFLLDPVDVVVADLPVGYYPDDIIAESYELKAKEGHSYAHHLFIEQSLNYSKEGAYLFFLVPEFLFDSDQAEQLNSFIHKHAHIVGVIRLPENAFRSKKNVKSIFIIQKKGEGTKAPQQPLLAMLPSFEDTQGMENILSQMNDWFITYHEKRKS